MDHAWSLAIEEQYYVLWPLVLILVTRFMPLNLATITVAYFAVLVVLWRNYLLLDDAENNRIFLSFDTHTDGLFLGAAVALACTLPGCLDSPRLRVALCWAEPIALGVIVGTAASITLFSPFMLSMGYTISAMSAAVLIARMALPGPCGLRDLLSIGPVVAMGRISYGLYLWHWPIFFAMRQEFGAGILEVMTLGVLLTFAAATASYVLVERPALRLKNRPS